MFNDLSLEPGDDNFTVIVVFQNQVNRLDVYRLEVNY